jgi:hypothetical protein
MAVQIIRIRHFTGPAVAWSNERRNAPQLQAVLKIAKGETAKL